MTKERAVNPFIVQTQPGPQTLISLEEFLKILPILAPQQAPQASPSGSSSWSFTQGLLIGQVSVLVVIAIFVKFFVFAEHPKHQPVSTKVSIAGKSSKTGKYNTQANKTRDLDQIISTSTILEKTYYDVKTHTSETLDWFNVLIAQTISQFRSEALLRDNLYHSLDDYLSNTELPDYLDKIKITDIEIGDDFPIFSNCRIRHSDHNDALGSGRLEAKIDLDLSDTLTLGIETKLLINKPKLMTASLPISLKVSIVRFSGCLTVSLINASDELFDTDDKAETTIPLRDEDGSSAKSGGTALLFSFSPDYRLEFQISSLIGSRSKLQDVPKISWLIESTLRNWVMERCVEPRYQLIKLPSMWPRRKNTRGTTLSGDKTTSDD
ncbi:hypothetical protein BABINDRAFT_160969 [Babjeviella inositovora NRRL Y-12698]|uniref:Maintenance of mitochondrial morphology protein 1 n=1 Tax=Babjeviella inositovora NRRL Y-12698 TaxID=984486 RepID=A0A1E3QSR4_9ASCO|nr:uncharacterized protein BABINDRAFT_160969 [Babjeviella inositovora NRRL Y-12698]ODQ80753.1 hypothetical protein BABINDRAFT_160969 [Babjeviella inositovora NRRL Y-12698]